MLLPCYRYDIATLLPLPRPCFDAQGGCAWEGTRRGRGRAGECWGEAIGGPPRRPWRRGSRARSGKPWVRQGPSGDPRAISRGRPRGPPRAISRGRLSAGGAAGYPVATPLVPRRPDRSDGGSASARWRSGRRTARPRASKSWSGQSWRLGRRISFATEEDGGRARGAGTTCAARRGPLRTERAWRSQALVVASSG